MSIMVLTWLLPVSIAVVLLVAATSSRPLFLNPRTYAEAAAGLLIASFPFTLFTPFTFITKIVLGVLQLILVFLVSRLLFGRLEKAFINTSTRGNVFIIFGGILAICCTWLLAVWVPGLLGNYEWRWVLLVCAALAAQLIFLRQLLWAFGHYRLRLSETKRILRDLPTVSVCIPARNEDHALEDCLTSVLASTYPKLEVLVLDDCSQDATSQIIRSFAHDGVRFIQGDAPADGWLGKNQAMQTLTEQATGEYIVFMDVDTRLNTTSIAQLVNEVLDNKLEMVAILPQNRLGMQPGAFFGTLRYFWQMVLPITRRRVPIAEQCWLIKATTLEEMGSFKSVARKIIPSARFARTLFDKDLYRFVAGSSELGITTAKRWSSEVESALRVLYPTYRRQPIIAIGSSLIICVVQLTPLIFCGWLLVNGTYDWVLALCAVTYGLALVNFSLVLRRNRPHSWMFTTLLLPVITLQEIVLIIVSMLKYEFGEITWKGRNVCYPVILSERSRGERRALQPRRRL